MEPHKSTVVRVQSQEEYNELMEILEPQGFKWLCGSASSEKNYYTIFKDKTCILITKILSYHNYHYFLTTGMCNIISLSEFKENKSPKGK